MRTIPRAGGRVRRPRRRRPRPARGHMAKPHMRAAGLRGGARASRVNAKKPLSWLFCRAAQTGPEAVGQSQTRHGCRARRPHHSRQPGRLRECCVRLQFCKTAGSRRGRCCGALCVISPVGNRRLACSIQSVRDKATLQGARPAGRICTREPPKRGSAYRRRIAAARN